MSRSFELLPCLLLDIIDNGMWNYLEVTGMHVPGGFFVAENPTLDTEITFLSLMAVEIMVTWNITVSDVIMSRDRWNIITAQCQS